MTPEEILSSYEAKQWHDTKGAKQQAIEAIHQYAKDFAKQMCDKQKQECLLAWGKVYTNNLGDDGNAIFNAPYPKELQ